MTDLKDILARLDAASPGPWRALSGAKQRSHEAYYGRSISSAAFPMVLSNDEFVLGELSAWTSDGDRALIVNARRDMEYLYDEVRVSRDYLRAVLEGEPGAEEAARHYLACVTSSDDGEER